MAEWFSMELPATRCEVINQASMQEEQMQSQIACAEQKKGKQHQKMKSNIHWKFSSDTQQQDEEDSTGDQQDIVSAHMKGWTDLEESRERACFNQQVQNA